MSAGKKLLVPIDGSANSLRALALVIKRVKKDRRLRMCLLNVQTAASPQLVRDANNDRGISRVEEQRGLGKIP